MPAAPTRRAVPAQPATVPAGGPTAPVRPGRSWRQQPSAARGGRLLPDPVPFLAREPMPVPPRPARPCGRRRLACRPVGLSGPRNERGFRTTTVERMAALCGYYNVPLVEVLTGHPAPPPPPHRANQPAAAASDVAAAQQTRALGRLTASVEPAHPPGHRRAGRRCSPSAPWGLRGPRPGPEHHSGTPAAAGSQGRTPPRVGPANPSSPSGAPPGRCRAGQRLLRTAG